VDLLSVVVFLIIVMIAIQFWRLRAIAEYTVEYANLYCKRHQLQYISLARTATKFTAYNGRLDWQLNYQLEFSSDGQTEYVGSIVTHGKHVIEIELPAYRVESAEKDVNY
jgi:hypothetical protein